MKFLSIMLALSVSLLLRSQGAEKIYLLKVAKLYDSEKNSFLKNQEILVKGKKIEKVGTNLTKPEGAEVISLQSCTVTPGLIDAHTHVLTIQKMTDPLKQTFLSMVTWKERCGPLVFVRVF